MSKLIILTEEQFNDVFINEVKSDLLQEFYANRNKFIKDIEGLAKQAVIHIALVFYLKMEKHDNNYDQYENHWR